MDISKDWIDLLQLFQKHDVRFMIVGGHAVIAYGWPRSTQNLDLFIDISSENAAKVTRALTEFLGENDVFAVENFSQPDRVTMLGVPPYRIDILTSIAGVTFEATFPNHQVFTFGGMNVPFIGYEDLISNKIAAGRAKDLGDVDELNKRRDMS